MELSHKLLIAAVCAVPVVLIANSTGPEPGNSGAPSEQTCARSGCHTGTALNVNGNQIDIAFEGGATYTPGTRKRITVTVREQANAYGFQTSARRVSDNSQAGTFSAASGQMVLCADGAMPPCRATASVQYVEHSAPSTVNTFAFDWTPPESAIGDIRFYVAANAANGNRTNTGDRIYTNNATLTPAGGGGGGGGSAPSIQSSEGVVNGASFSATVQGGSWVTIRGTNLSTTTRTWTDADFNGNNLPTALDGVRVNIGGTAASVFYISPTQINVLAPNLTATGTVPIEVTNAAGTTSGQANAQTSSPGFFLFDPDNRRYPAAVHTDGVFIGRAGLFGSALTTRPVRPGDTILLFGTGFGPTNPVVQANQRNQPVAPVTTNPTVRIGGVNATVSFAGIVSPGLYQLNVVVPDVPNGDQALVAELSGSATQSNVALTVQR